MTKLIKDKSTIVSLLAKRLDVQPSDLGFLFGENSNREANLVIPDYRKMSQKKVSLKT